MILMKRIHMINWMYYGTQTVEFAQSNLLTGITGSGKSTIIDALQVVLLGQTGRGFFNKSASGARSDRTIETYLRGKYSDNGYKRDKKSFSSYIFIDFHDEYKNDIFSYGAAFDLEADGECVKDFMRLDCAFDIKYALEDRKALSRKKFKKSLDEFGVKYTSFGTNLAYQKDFLARCGIYDAQFFSVFKTAVAYVPLDKIEDFIVKNICHVEDSLDISKMRASILDYQKMLQDMDDFENRRVELEAIKSTANDYLGKIELLQEQSYFVERAEVDKLSQEIEEAEGLIAAKEKTLITLKSEKNSLSERRDLFRKKREDLLDEYNKDPERRRHEELEREYNQQEDKIKEHKKAGENQLLLFNQRAFTWVKKLEAFAQLRSELDLWPWQETYHIKQALAEDARHTLATFAKFNLQRFEQTCIDIELLHKRALVQADALSTKVTGLTEEIVSCSEKLAELDKGKKRYPEDLLRLKTHLEKSLYEKHKREVSVNILADLIEINNIEWTNAIEGYISRQRLYLLIEPEYYKDSVCFFKKYSQETFCFSYNIVNTKSLMQEQFTVLEDSLAAIITTTHSAARKYIDYLLGQVKCVENIEDAMGRSTAITKEGMLYHTFSVARMDSKKWWLQYIGKNSILQQIDAYKKQMLLLQTELDAFNCIKVQVEAIATESVFSCEFVQNMQLSIACLQEVPSLEKRCDEIASQLTRLDDSYSKSLLKAADESENERVKADEAFDKCSNKVTLLEHSVADLCIKVSDVQDEHKEVSSMFISKYASFELENDATVSKYESILRHKTVAEKLRADYESARGGTRSAINNLQIAFTNAVSKFNTNHSDSAISTDITSSEWEKAYQQVSGVSIAEQQEGIAQARRQAEEIFHNEFINQIKRNIDTVRAEIKSLNNALQDFRFGQVRYRFKCEPTDNPELRKYHDLIMNTDLNGISLDSFLNRQNYLEEYEPMVKTLFNLISAEGTDAVSRQQLADNIDRYKSFKTYLKFDLVEVDNNGREQALSRTMGTKSGGEKQTPFYIAILASLMKAYRMNQNTNSLRLVIFDEAFDKIDTSRIEECVNMLNEVGFQSVIVAPNDKAPYIAPMVKRTWVVTKPDEKTSLVCEYKKDFGDEN